MPRTTKYYSLEKADRTAELLIFGDITSFPWTDSDVSAYNIAAELAVLDVDEINVRINSYGGECAEAMAIVNALTRHPARVVTWDEGVACSAAATVFMAGDERMAGRYCLFLIHDAWTWAEGNAEQLRAEADNLDRYTEQSKKLYLEKSGIKEEELNTLMKAERLLTPEEMLAYGFATAIAGAEEGEGEGVSQSARKLVMEGLIRSHREPTAAGEIVFPEEAVERIATRVAEKLRPEENARQQSGKTRQERENANRIKEGFLKYLTEKEG